MGQGCPRQLRSKICIVDTQSFDVKSLINLTWEPMVGKHISSCQGMKGVARGIKKQERPEVGGNELMCIISEDILERASKSKALYVAISATHLPMSKKRTFFVMEYDRQTTD